MLKKHDDIVRKQEEHSKLKNQHSKKRENYNAETSTINTVEVNAPVAQMTTGDVFKNTHLHSGTILADDGLVHQASHGGSYGSSKKTSTVTVRRKVSGEWKSMSPHNRIESDQQLQGTLKLHPDQFNFL